MLSNSLGRISKVREMQAPFESINLVLFIMDPKPAVSRSLLLLRGSESTITRIIDTHLLAAACTVPEITIMAVE